MWNAYKNSFGQSGQQKPCGRRYRITKINTKTDKHPPYPLHFAYGEAHFRKYKINTIHITYVFTLCNGLLTAHDAHNQIQETKSLLLAKIICGLIKIDVMEMASRMRSRSFRVGQSPVQYFKDVFRKVRNRCNTIQIWGAATSPIKFAHNVDSVQVTFILF